MLRLGVHYLISTIGSFDPSVFDVRFEGMVVFDHGDGLLRNDYVSPSVL